MGTNKGRSDFGSVGTYVISRTRAMLVIDDSFSDARWKLPCGGIEASDGGAAVAAMTDPGEQVKERVIAAAIREVREETGGIELVPQEVTLVETQTRVNGVYYPYFCVACVSEGKIDTHKSVGDEDGKKLRPAAFNRSEVPDMVDLLDRHRAFVQKIEDAMR